MNEANAAQVIVDIDETVLDNSPYQARLVVNNASYDEFTWAQWCREVDPCKITCKNL